MRALIRYSHGCGDVLMATPCFKKLHEEGYEIDLMCRPSVIKSHLLDECPFVTNLIEVPNPWLSELGWKQQVMDTTVNFMEKAQDYDWAGMSLHTTVTKGEHKIDMTARELGIVLDTRSPMVFVDEHHRARAKRWAEKDYPDGFIHVHTDIELHPNHTWDAGNWIGQNLPNLPVFNTGADWGVMKEFREMEDDINILFAMQALATHRVYSSSVMVHSADAQGLKIDVINYGTPDRKVWPVNVEADHIREEGKWIK